MIRTWTIIGVADVARSFAWYQALFGQPATRPAHDYFGQILDADGTVLLCLHQWGEHEHPTLASPDRAQPGTPVGSARSALSPPKISRTGADARRGGRTSVPVVGVRRGGDSEPGWLRHSRRYIAE